MTSSHITSPMQRYFLTLSPLPPSPHPISLPTQLARISIRQKDALTSPASASTSVWVVMEIIPSSSAKQRRPPLTDYMVSFSLIVCRYLIKPFIHISQLTHLSSLCLQSPMQTSPSHIAISHSSLIGISHSSLIGISHSSLIGISHSSLIGISHSSPIGIRSEERRVGK